MLETPHVAVGIAIAAKLPHPWLSIPLSFASHFILDKVPHWNPRTYTETVTFGSPRRLTLTITAIDIISGLALGIWAANSALPNWSQAINILACSFASVSPDVSKYPFFLFKSTRKGAYQKWVKYERHLQVQTKSVFWGLLTQAIVTFAALHTPLF